jgi:hypothetical protein
MVPWTAKTSLCRRPSRHHRGGRALGSGAGVLLSYASYAGDRLNFSTPQPVLCLAWSCHRSIRSEAME